MKDSIFPYISASTPQHLWMQGVYKLQSGIKNTNFKIKVRKQDGSITQISILRNGEMTRTANDEYYGKIPSEDDKDYRAVRLKWLPDSVAYLEVRAFHPEEFIIKKIYSLQDSIANAKNLIIDLRRNGGGSTDVAWFLQSYLMKENNFLNYAWETRINDGVKRANGNWIEKYEDYYKGKAYQKEAADTVFVGDTILKFAILIGKYTFSAAEDFLVNLYEVPNRPVLIGEPTGGSTGSPLLIGKTFEEAFARVCTRRICFPYSGKPFVNEGIQPDIFIQQTIDDYLNNKDVVLEKAIEYLQSKK
jgi:C-terminal processing protease CtpA/Prc